jgi:hypothetical protein
MSKREMASPIQNWPQDLNKVPCDAWKHSDGMRVEVGTVIVGGNATSGMEAGLIGRIKHRPIGQFEYWKRTTDHFDLINVDVYPLKVEKRLKKWPEKGQRVRKWVRGADAALLVDEPHLVTLIREFCGINDDGNTVKDRRPKKTAAREEHRTAHQ